MSPTIVEIRFAEYKALLKVLYDGNEISMANSAEEDFRKVLTVSAASYFEKLIVHTLNEIAGSVSDRRMGEALKNTTFRREKFSSLFTWGESNVGGFVKIFGQQFKEHFLKTLAEPSLKDGMRAFLKLGEQRNYLVHNDFASSTTDQTLDEVFMQYPSARQFVDHLCEQLRTQNC